MSGLRAIAVLVAASTFGGCAWSNPANRPVWNVVEENLVPDSDGLYYATLPFTVVLGLGAFVVDTLIAHPIQVADDAFWDAAELWESHRLQFDTRYYTEMAVTPFRAVGTPVVGTLSFLARSMFDIPDREVEAVDPLAGEPEDPVAIGRRNFATWLDHIEKHPAEFQLVAAAPTAPELDAELRDRFERLLNGGTAMQRLRLHLGMIVEPVEGYDPTSALRDPDPIVRFHVLLMHAQRGGIPPALRALGVVDEVASIRELCR